MQKLVPPAIKLIDISNSLFPEAEEKYGSCFTRGLLFKEFHLKHLKVLLTELHCEAFVFHEGIESGNRFHGFYCKIEQLKK